MRSVPVRADVIGGEGSEQLMGAEGAFVFHGLAVMDEVAHVDPLQAHVFCLLKFLQHRPCPKSVLSPLRVMKEVDTAEAGAGDVDQSKADQAAVKAVLDFAGE